MFNKVYSDGWCGYEESRYVEIYEINNNRFFCIEHSNLVFGNHINRNFITLDEALEIIEEIDIANNEMSGDLL